MTSANVSMAMNMTVNTSGQKPLDKGKDEGEMSFMSAFSKSMELTGTNQSEASPRMGVTARTVVRVSDNRQSQDLLVSKQTENEPVNTSAETKAETNTALNDAKEADNSAKPKSEEKDSLGSETAVNTKAESKEETLSDEEVTELAGAVSQIIADIVETIQETLNVSTQDITDAMEALGMDITELSSFSAAKELFLSLSGEGADASDTALLFSEEFSQFSEKVSELLIEFDRNLDMSAAEAGELLGQAENFDFTEFASEINNIIAVEMTDDSTEEKAGFDVKGSMTEVGGLDAKQRADGAAEDKKGPAIEFLDEDVQDFGIKESEYSKNDAAFSGNQGFSNDSKKNSGIEPVTDQINEGIVFADEPVFNDAINEVTAPSGETVEVPRIIEQIVQRASIMSSNGETTMEMILNPEGLGKIYMQVSQKGDEVTARLMTENSAVKEALEASLAEVKEKLELSGTKVNDIEVSVGTHGFERNLEQDQHREQQEGAYQEELRSTTRRSLHIDSMENLMGLMSEEEQLAARIMKDNGGTLDYQA